MTRLRRVTVALLMVIAIAPPELARANRESDGLRARGAEEIYNLDRERAVQTYRDAIAADPQDPAAYRGLATGLWLTITFRRGNMTVDDYIGRVTRPNAALPPPPPETVAAFRDAIEHAIALARKRIEANPRDAEGHYQLGAALGLRASYVATVEGSALGAFRTARDAYDQHEKVLELDSRRKDAGLIVGTYRYIVSALALPLRLVAYVAGFGGDKERGLKMIEEAAVYGGDNAEDARFALLLLYNREKRYDDALKVLARLRDRYPRNRLVWFESGSTSLRAGKASDADRFLTEALARFATDTRLRMFGEDALLYYKRGAARVALGRADEARQDLTKAISLDGRDWVHGRAHLELGRLASKAGDSPTARRELDTAIVLCQRDNDPVAVEDARRLHK